jgi:hypothetical protein
MQWLKQELSYVSTFNTEETPNALAFVAKDALKIGSMESIQRLHIKTVPLGETPRRIAYQEQNRVFGLLTTKVLPSEEDELSSFKIVDDQTYESESTVTYSLYAFSYDSQSLTTSTWKNSKWRRVWSRVTLVTRKIPSLLQEQHLSCPMKRNPRRAVFLYLK